MSILSVGGVTKGLVKALKGVGRGAPRSVKAVTKAARKMPLTTGVTGLLGAEVVGGPFLRAGLDPFTNTSGGRVRDEFELRRLGIAHQMKVERLRRTMAENMARLASSSPHLYNQLLAGRRLPEDAEVIGGASSTDVLEEVAMAMSMGKFGTAPSGLETGAF
jgi:hypothetical protein